MACDSYNTADPFADKAEYELRLRALKRKYDAVVKELERVKRSALGHVRITEDLELIGRDLTFRDHSFGFIDPANLPTPE